MQNYIHGVQSTSALSLTNNNLDFIMYYLEVRYLRREHQKFNSLRFYCVCSKFVFQRPPVFGKVREAVFRCIKFCACSHKCARNIKLSLSVKNTQLHGIKTGSQKIEVVRSSRDCEVEFNWKVFTKTQSKHLVISFFECSPK